MSQLPQQELRVYLIYEPSYWRGFLVTVSSLVRHASGPLDIDILTRPAFVDDARKRVARVEKMIGGKARFHIVPMPEAILSYCDDFNFTSHFIPEVLFRLYYLDIVDPNSRFSVHVDIDMFWRGDIMGIIRDCETSALMSAVADTIPEPSKPLMPPEAKSYLNAGLMVLRTENLVAMKECMQQIQSFLPFVSGKSLYVDQDAIAIAMHDKLNYIDRKWNFMTKDVATGDPDSAINLHATGSRKPWHWRGGHPFAKYYEDERKHAGLSWLEAYDLFWGVKKAMKRVFG